MSGAIKRLRLEYKNFQEKPDRGIHIQPKNDNFLDWVAVIEGPKGTPYEGGSFTINIEVPPSYPFNPPKLRFKTPVYHPNISRDGRICMDLLKTNWSPALTLSSLLISLVSLMSAPNPDDPLVFTIADTYKNDRELFDLTAMHWTRAYANDNTDFMNHCGI
uniref:ubiquitin-conjugating enzyme E2 11-like n=1 Tax=Ciona intestinalis TaxID=7719 RepID=UPI000180CF52|nr:ubiquitin-conjugating enzyme E2 11-like [Ciona intestinalis]|eukprot:XP_002126720.1 ubiquitin-conjugating enzyme E2 11-like [Ciona intestinalis]